jgi:hypothetical protein
MIEMLEEIEKINLYFPEEKLMPQNSIIANLQEKMIGQLAVGDRIIKIGTSHGAIVTIATNEEKSILSSRSTPVFIQENWLDNLLGRQEIVTEAIAALGVGESVEFYSPAGFGKTVLLSSLVQEIQAMSLFEDGIVNISPVHPHVGDILQSIWEAFYESNIPYKPTHSQIFTQIQDKHALIVLDDDDLIREELQELMNRTGRCTFLIASSTSRIYKKGRSISISGLSTVSAIALVEKELQRPLTREELPAAKSLCDILNGHPMHLKIAVATILAEGQSLAELVSQLPTFEPSQYLIQQILASLSQPQRTIVNLLAVTGKIGLESKHIVRITQFPDAFSILETLCKKHVIQLHGSHYKINQAIVDSFPPEWKLTASVENIIAYFINWVEKHHTQHKMVLEEIDVIVQIIEVAVRNSRWQNVLQLVKAVESVIALTKRWDLWQQVLRRGLQASQALQNKAAEAWAFHQLGTCHLCLEENSTARDYLTQALHIRESIDDKPGIAATRHNLSLLKDSPSSSSTHNGQHESLKDRENNAKESSDSLPEDLKSQSPSQPLVTRMHIVSDNASSSNNSFFKNIFLLSPTGIITTGIIASGGFFAWSNWHRFIPTSPPTSTPQPTKAITPSPIAKPTPTQPDVLVSPIPEKLPTTGTTLSPLPKHSPVVNPPLTPPDFKIQQPVQRRQLKIKPTPAPIPQTQPQAEPIPELTPSPTPTAESESSLDATPFLTPPTETEPTLDVTPSPTPPTETETTPEVVPSPTPPTEAETTPEVVPSPTPTAEAETTSEVSPSPTPTAETETTSEVPPSPTPTAEAEPAPTFTPYFTSVPTPKTTKSALETLPRK